MQLIIYDIIQSDKNSKELNNYEEKYIMDYY